MSVEPRRPCGRCGLSVLCTCYCDRSPPINTRPVDTGNNPKDAAGDKKARLCLVPPALGIYAGAVMALGAKKYGPYNWRSNKVRRTVYIEAAIRHLYAVFDGEDIDPESGQPHEAHAASCMAILLDAMATGNLIDDRPPAGAAARLMSESTVP